MGSLDRLNICNFKSYGETHVVGPFKTFTAIVGPNGAGKSNLMDAISFVLGVRTQQLRGAQLRDLIHRREHEKPEEQHRSAYVELVYKNAKGAETSFRRSIDSTGTGQYRLNAKVVKWEQYNEALQSIGVLVRARNFLVFQGDVESIAQKSPAELTQLIEVISGSGDLKKDYETLKEQAEKAEEEFIGTFEKKRAMGKEKKQIKEQKEEADKFHRLQAEQTRLKTEFFVWQLFNVEKDLQHNFEAMKAVQAEVDEKKGLFAKADAEVKVKQKDCATARRDMQSLQKLIEKKSRTLEKKRPNLIKLGEQIAFLDRTLKQSERTHEKLSVDARKQADDIKAIENELKGVERSIKEVADEERKAGGELKLADDQQREYIRLKEAAGAKTSGLRGELDAIKRGYRIDEESVKNLESQLSTLNTRKSQLEEARVKLEERRARMQSLVDETRERLDEGRAKQKEFVSRSKQASTRKEELGKLLSEANDQLGDADLDKRQSEKEQRMVETLESLKSHFPGVRGRIVDLCKPTAKKYQLAVTVALGKNMDAIVVNDERTAIECINYMKENRVGAATFLPLDTIKVKDGGYEALRQLGGSLQPVLDVIEFDDSIRKALLYSCGTALVCDTLEEARRLCYSGSSDKRYKVVALDGTLIHKNGNLTGGVGDFLKKARKWDEKELSKVKQQKDKWYQEMLELEQTHRSDSQQQLDSEIKGLESRVKNSDIDLGITTEKLGKGDDEIKAIDADIARKRPELEKISGVLKNKEKEIQKLEDRIRVEQRKVFGGFAAAVGVSDIAEYEERRIQAAEKLIERKQQLAQQEARLKNQLDYEKKRDLAGPLFELTARMKEDRDKLDKARAEEKKTRDQEDEDKGTVDEEHKKFSELEKKLDEDQKALRQAKKDAYTAQKDIVAAEKRLTVKEGIVAQMRNIRREVFRRCKLENIDLPRSRSAPGEARKKKAAAPKSPKKGEKEKKKKGDGEDKEEEEEPEEEDEDPVDFSILTENREVKNASQYEKVKAQYVEKLGEIASEVEQLAPNLKALDKYEDIKERLQTTKEDWEDKKKESKRTADSFEKKRQERNDLFNKAFKHVSDNIDAIYKRLTKSEKFPMGGTAYLTLETTEDPFLSGINYTAMPPAKRFREMHQLSGGEKTVAALALLFAIHGYHPAPFFVLDEIDAALDNINVARVSNYIKERSRVDKLQCIVISLKDTFYTKADGLIGVYKDQVKESSGNLTLDLMKYDRYTPASAPLSEPSASQDSRGDSRPRDRDSSPSPSPARQRPPVPSSSSSSSSAASGSKRTVPGRAVSGGAGSSSSGSSASAAGSGTGSGKKPRAGGTPPSAGKAPPAAEKSTRSGKDPVVSETEEERSGKSEVDEEEEKPKRRRG